MSTERTIGYVSVAEKNEVLEEAEAKAAEFPAYKPRHVRSFTKKGSLPNKPGKRSKYLKPW